MDILDRASQDSAEMNYYQQTYRQINNTVFRPGKERTIFFMDWSHETREILSKVGSVEFKIEYRSVLEDYWVFDSESESNKQRRFTSELEFTSSR